MNEVGSKELQELINGLMALSCKLAKHLKDGFQWHDIPAMMNEYRSDKEFAEYLNKAFEGVSKIPAEMKELNALDGVGLASSILPWIQKLMNELK